MNKTFSFRVTEKDILEFNSWIKSKDIHPRLRGNFKSDKEYEDFMIDYQDKHSDVFDSNNSGNKSFSSYKDDVGRMHDKILNYFMSLMRSQYQYTEEVKSYLKKVMNSFDSVKVFSDGKCPADGCIQKDGDKWMIISNKTGEPWKPRYETREKAENALKAYHASKGFTKLDGGYIFVIDAEDTELGGTHSIYLTDSEVKSRRYVELFNYNQFRIKSGITKLIPTSNWQSLKPITAIDLEHEDNELDASELIRAYSRPNMYGYQSKNIERYINPDVPITDKYDVDKSAWINVLSSPKGHTFAGTYSFYKSGKDEWTQVYVDKPEVVSSDELVSFIKALEKKNGNVRIIGNNLKKPMVFSESFSNSKSKSFSDTSLTVKNDPSIVSSRESLGNTPSTQGDIKLETKVPSITADWNGTKPFNLSIEPWIVVNSINDVSDGLYIGELLGNRINIGSDFIDIDLRSGESQPTKVLSLVKNKKVYVFKLAQLSTKSKTFSNQNAYQVTYIDSRYPDAKKSKIYHGSDEDEVMDKFHKYLKNGYELISIDKLDDKTFSNGIPDNYQFSIIPTEVTYDMQHLIGSWMMAPSICHLYHICDQKYSGHKALDEFYTEFPEKIDALAEHFLADNDTAQFRVCVVPGNCPIEYLTNLVKYTDSYCKLNSDKLTSAYQSQIDDIINFTQGILYKLKRLGSGRRWFSMK